MASRAAAASLQDIGDPTADESYSICLYVGRQPVLDALIPAGGICGTRPCWSSRPHGYTFSDASGAADGVRRFSLGIANSLAKFRLVARGENLDPVSLPFPAGLIAVNVANSRNGLCWNGIYYPYTNVRNSSTTFYARAR